MGDINFRQKILKLPPSPYSKIFFWYQIFCKLQKGSCTKFSDTVRQQCFFGKLWPFPLRQILFNIRHFVNYRRVSLWSFFVLWDKTILTENCDTRPFLFLNSFRYQFFSETQNGSISKFFSTARQQNVDRKSWHNHLNHRIFGYPKKLKHYKRILVWFFAHCDTKRFWKKTVVLPPSSLVLKIFQYQKLVKHSRVRWRRLSVLWSKTYSLENCGPSRARHKNFRYLKPCETEKIFRTKRLRFVRDNFFDGKSWFPHLSYP